MKDVLTSLKTRNQYQCQYQNTKVPTIVNEVSVSQAGP